MIYRDEYELFNNDVIALENGKINIKDNQLFKEISQKNRAKH